MQRRIALFILLAGLLGLITGCQTVAGFGRDLESAANAIQNTAR